MTMRAALAQINPTVGDIEGNSRLIRGSIQRAGDAGAELVVFPELSVIGYPPKDLLLKPAVILACRQAVDELAKDCRGIAAIIGHPCPSDNDTGRMLYNAATLCHDGRPRHRRVKSLLPTYDVFDEHRYFEPGPDVQITPMNGLGLGISICEDLWNDRDVVARRLYHDNPIDQLARRGADLFINCSASPFTVGKHALRMALMREAARRHGLPVLYCNQVGGNDELVFDGCSCAVGPGGELIGQAKDFAPDLLIVDVPVGGAGSAKPQARPGAQANTERHTASKPSAGRVETISHGIASAYHALVLGLRDYCQKCGFKSVVLGLSGGIDSAVCCALAVAALGKDHVTGVTMPSRFSSDGSVSDAQVLAQNLGIGFHTVAIEQAHKAFEQMLAPLFQGTDPGVAEENIQARARGVLLMALSNKFGSLLVTTGNKSELAVGYCTLYGDMAGGLAVLSDVPKTLVYELANWINDDPASPLRKEFGKPVIPRDTITKPPSAELREDQTDQDSLPPYDVLDEIIERFVEQEQSAKQIIEDTGFDPEVVLKMIRLIDLNEYKRKQAAPGLKITGRAFGFGRRMPIAQRYDNRRAVEADEKEETQQG
jgi:NAD+ synthase (glutamine-hydrolysing)